MAIVSLNCLVYGDEPPFSHIVDVKVSSNEKITELRKKILGGTKHQYGHVDAKNFVLYTPTTAISTASKATFNEGFAQLHLDTEEGQALVEELNPTRTVSKYEVLVTAQEEQLHVIIVVPIAQASSLGKRLREEESVLSLSASYFSAQDQQAKRYRKGPVPSEVCRSAGMMAEQQKEAEILNGRPWSSSGPPVGLYHPIFDRFTKYLDESAPDYKSASSLDNTDVRPTIGDVFSFMRACSEFYDVKERTARDPLVVRGRVDSVLPLLSRLLCNDPLRLVNSDATKPDVVFSAKTSEFQNVPAGILEVKLEEGISGDAKVQAQQSYARMFSLPEHEAIRQRCCSPCFLIELSGPWIMVLGAVYTQKVIVQHLAGPIYLPPQLLHPQSTFDASLRLFYALRMALLELSEYYGKLSYSTRVPPFFPSVNSYSNSEGVQRRFEYRMPLSSDDSKAVYEATDADGRKIVVKFASTYNAQAHHLLAWNGLAPKLLYDGTGGPRYGGLLMIVMSHINGTTLNKWLSRLQRLDPLLDTILDSVTQAIDLLHKDDLVFGDLRTPNVMVDNSGGAKLVDFDWCGVDGVGKYPFIIGDGIPWADGVGPQETIHKGHDLHMLQQLKDKIHSGAKLDTW